MTRRSGDLWGPEKMPPLLLMTQPPGILKIRHDQPDLEGSDKDSFQRMIRRCQKCVDPQGSTFTDE